MKWNDCDNDGIYDTGEQPLPGWTIQLGTTDNCGSIKETQTTDANGKYTINNLPVGTLTINITALPPYTSQNISVTIEAGKTTTKDIKLKAVTTVLVSVKSGGLFGLPIQGATVKLGTATGTTDILGMVTLTVNPGTYDLEVSASGQKNFKKSVTIDKGSNTLEVTMASSSGGGTDGGLIALLFGALCLILFLPLLIVIVIIVVIIVVIRRRKKAKAAAAQAAAAPAYPPQGVPPPPPGNVPPMPPQRPPGP